MFNQYIFVLIWVGFMALIANSFLRYEYLHGEAVIRNTFLFAFIAIFPVIYIAGTRNWIADTSAYILHYREMPSSLSNLGEYLLVRTKDKGFSALSVFLKGLFQGYDGIDYRPYLMTLSLFQGISVCRFLRKYSEKYIFSLFLFVASADYFLWMFNGLRQFMAVTTILFAVPYMIEKKYIKAIVIILLASTFHQSALIMIPFVFISQGEAWNRKTLLFILATVLAIVFVGNFTNLMNDALENTQYVNVVSDYQSINDDGTNPIRVLVYSIPTILAFFYRAQIREYGNNVINFACNMSIVSTCLYVISMMTSGIYIGRLPIYCSLFNYILLPWILDNCFSYNKGTMKIATIVGYLSYYYVQMHFISGVF